MKFTTALSEFQSILQKTLPAIPKKSTLPVLEHLHFSLSGSKLRIIATDQDITIMSTLNVNGEEDGSVLIPGKRINEIIKAMSHSGEIEISTKEDSFDITIKTANGKYGMKGLNPDEYLDLPELFDSEKPHFDKPEDLNPADGMIDVGDDNKIPAAYFKKADIAKIASKTVFAVSTDEFRPAMNGVLFQFRGTYINTVATDSFRLVKATLNSDKALFPSDIDLIIPARAVDILKKIDNDLVMSFIETNNKITHTRFDVGDTVFISKLIDEKFPPYESVIPQDNSINVKISKKELLSAIKRVAIFTSEISLQVRIVLENDQLKVTGEDEETGANADEVLTCDYQGEQFMIGFNHKYLEEALQNVESNDDDNIILMLSEPTRPALLKPGTEEDDLLMLIMPVRLS
jgi:DNA polymerase III subunit beta